MKVEFDKSFEKSLQKIKNKSLFLRIEKIIFECDKAKSLSEVTNIKKAYRIQELLQNTNWRIQIRNRVK